MNSFNQPVRVLYSFPHRMGTGRICTTAWEQVRSLAAAGAHVEVHAASTGRSLPDGVAVKTTLAWGRLRVPYRLVGDMRAFVTHDRLVARRVRRLKERVDIIHCWPLGSLRTLAVAAELGIPTVLERPNAHTRFAYEVVRDECERIGVPLPADHEHAYNEEVLRIEEEEYRRADRLLCPSEFTARTFLDRGFPQEKLARHFYGYDPATFHAQGRCDDGRRPFTALSVGVCAVRKGLHFALEAWLQSPASHTGKFLIAGEFLPAYAEQLSSMLAHPSVEVLGHRNDVPELMRRSDVLLLPSIEEGFGLVCTEAMASGCVPAVSDACTDLCRHLENSLVHRVGDAAELTRHITSLYEQPELRARLQASGVALAPLITWEAAGRQLLALYRATIDDHARQAIRSESRRWLSRSNLHTRMLNTPDR